jgi:hypothetical protein
MGRSRVLRGSEGVLWTYEIVCTGPLTRGSGSICGKDQLEYRGQRGSGVK